MDLCSTSLSSSRVVLRSFRPEDAREVFAAATPMLARYMSWDPAPCLDTFEKIWRGWLPLMAKGSDLHLVVRLGASEEFLGMAGLHNIGASEPDAGIWIKEAKHGNRYGRDAVAAVVLFAARPLGKKAVLYPVAEENGPSRRLAQSLNGKIIGKRLLRKSSGIEYPQVVYRIPVPLVSSV
jgi:RimJ/RimL family protein N-acetyltransferase